MLRAELLAELRADDKPLDGGSMLNGKDARGMASEACLRWWWRGAVSMETDMSRSPDRDVSCGPRALSTGSATAADANGPAGATAFRTGLQARPGASAPTIRAMVKRQF